MASVSVLTRFLFLITGHRSENVICICCSYTICFCCFWVVSIQGVHDCCHQFMMNSKSRGFGIFMYRNFTIHAVSTTCRLIYNKLIFVVRKLFDGRGCHTFFTNLIERCKPPRKTISHGFSSWIVVHMKKVWKSSLSLIFGILIRCPRCTDAVYTRRSLANRRRQLWYLFFYCLSHICTFSWILKAGPGFSCDYRNFRCRIFSIFTSVFCAIDNTNISMNTLIQCTFVV